MIPRPAIEAPVRGSRAVTETWYFAPIRQSRSGPLRQASNVRSRSNTPLLVAAWRYRPLESIASERIGIGRNGSNRVQVTPESFVQKRPSVVPANRVEE